MKRRSPGDALDIPADANAATLAIDGRRVDLTNLNKPFWPDLGITKRGLLQYYADIAPFLLPHLRDRAMVMKRYPDGAAGKFFFMKRVPDHHPDWMQTCSIAHSEAGTVTFPMVQDLASLLWVVNLGCIDMNPWYARCDDTDRPDYLHFDLDPVKGKPEVGFDKIRATALILHDALNQLGMPNYAKTTGSRGIHVYVPLERGSTQKEVWTFAKALAQTVARGEPELITTEYRIAKRPAGRVLVDYNQNAWGRTLASVYSVRPRPLATVSTPVTWDEIKRGFDIEAFRIDNVLARIRRLGDLWKPLLEKRGRVRLDRLAAPAEV